MSKINVPAEFLNDYANYVKSDYIKWWGKERSSETVVKMINEFNVAFEIGSTYIKVVKTKNGVVQSVHSFISNKNGKFPLGTILKAASFKAPATNFGRGNLLDKQTWDRVQWTGVI